MSKERLAEVKGVLKDIAKYELSECRDQKQADMAKCYLVERHGEWLSRQAKRKQELEKEYSKCVDSHTHLEMKNIRYRKLFDSIMDLQLYVNYTEQELYQEVLKMTNYFLENESNDNKRRVEKIESGLKVMEEMFSKPNFELEKFNWDVLISDMTFLIALIRDKSEEIQKLRLQRDKIKSLEKQTKCYRELIKDVRDELLIHYRMGGSSDNDALMMLDRALEGENETTTY